MSWSPVLSCPVLSCPVLSCPVLSCPVLCCSDCATACDDSPLDMALHVKEYLCMFDIVGRCFLKVCCCQLVEV